MYKRAFFLFYNLKTFLAKQGEHKSHLHGIVVNFLVASYLMHKLMSLH